MLRNLTLAILAATSFQTAFAATIRVPQDQKSIQAAIDSSQEGDVVLVSPGRYHERIRLKSGIIVRSTGDDAKGADGFQRAEMTVIDGKGRAGMQPGVAMAEGSTLDGFTITNVGQFDEATWKRHYDSHGEELGDEEGAVQAEGTIPAVSIRGVTCTVSRNIIHHNGDVGIGILGAENTRTAPLISENLVYRNLGGGIGTADWAEPVIRSNVSKENLRAGIGCRKSSPLLVDNVCFQNVRAGIGCREGSKAVMRGNKCFQNRRAGIGIRMEGTSPLVEANNCYENEMAGIGCRDGASPVLRNNVCLRNKLAGIGCRNEARAVIVGNECRENETAGIGVESKADAVIQQNRCTGNKLVAIGVTDGATALIGENELSRAGGHAPIIAVKGGASATIRNNRIMGGGVAAVLIQGTAHLMGNAFAGSAPTQGNAVWVWENSKATISDNSFDGYQSAVQAAKATVVVTGNSVRNFREVSIIVKDSRTPAHVFGNTAISTDPQARSVEILGPSGIVADNTVTMAKSDAARR